MPLRNYLAAIAIFCNEVKGKSALALSRDLGCQCKTFVLAHKIREAMASELKKGGHHTICPKSCANRPWWSARPFGA